MMRLRFLPRVTVEACVALFIAFPALVPAQSMPSDSDVRAIIKPRVDTGRYAGIAVGLVSRDGKQQVTAYGPRAGVTPFDGNTVFEIGSITKTFTAAILADMVAKREVALDDPVVKHLPAGTKVPVSGGKQITLLDLATQTGQRAPFQEAQHLGVAPLAIGAGGPELAAQEGPVLQQSLERRLDDALRQLPALSRARRQERAMAARPAAEEPVERV